MKENASILFPKDWTRWKQYIKAIILAILLNMLVIYLMRLVSYQSMESKVVINSLLKNLCEVSVFTICVFPVSLILTSYLLKIFWEGEHSLYRFGAYLFLLFLLNFIISYLFTTIYDYISGSEILNFHILVGQNVSLAFLSSVFYAPFLLIRAKEEKENKERAQLDAIARKNETIRARLDKLTVELDPHYIFNGLSTLSGLISTDSESAEIFLNKFSSTFRYFLDNRERHVVTIREEFNFLKDYIEMIEYRYDNVTIQVDPNLHDVTGVLPVAALQELVENAIKHNAHTNSKKLVISIEYDNNCILVKNNKNPLLSTKRSTHIGLHNIVERYGYLSYKRPVMEDTEDTFCVRLPILYLEDLTELE